LKSCLQINHVPVHEKYSAMVRNIITASKTPSLNRIVRFRDSLSILGLKVYSIGHMYFGIEYGVQGLEFMIYEIGMGYRITS